MGAIVVQCVVVIYKCRLEESRTLRSLLSSGKERKDLTQRIALLIYDNSPVPQLHRMDESIFGSIEYHHPGENRGLSGAYSEALSMARDSGIEWLLLLDQDTVLNVDFLSALMEAIASSLPAEVCAIVPKVVQEEKILSPQFLTRFRRHHLLPGFAGVHSKPIAALNSGACMRVKAVMAVGGFPRDYWLDYLDHIMFYRLQAGGGRVWILDVKLQHRLSFQNIEKEMSVTRYRGLLAAEWGYIRESGADGGTWAHRLRLIKRALGQALRLNNKAYAMLSFNAAIAPRMLPGYSLDVDRKMLGGLLSTNPQEAFMIRQWRSFYKLLKNQGIKSFSRTVVGSASLKLRIYVRGRNRAVSLDGCRFELRDLPNTRMKLQLLTGKYELPERIAIRQYIRANWSVVELGACIGVVSCVTNKMLTNPRHHVVLEANPLVIPHLTSNRDANNCSFKIVNSALAYNGDRVTFSPWLDYWGNSLQHDGGQPPVTVRATRLSQLLEDEHYKDFALICDIEGQEYELVMQEGDALRSAQLIIMETHPHVIGVDKTHALLSKLADLGFRTIDRNALVVVLAKA